MLLSHSRSSDHEDPEHKQEHPNGDDVAVTVELLGLSLVLELGDKLLGLGPRGERIHHGALRRLPMVMGLDGREVALMLAV